MRNQTITETVFQHAHKQTEELIHDLEWTIKSCKFRRLSTKKLHRKLIASEETSLSSDQLVLRFSSAILQDPWAQFYAFPEHFTFLKLSRTKDQKEKGKFT